MKELKDGYIDCKGCFFADQEYCPYFCFYPCFPDGRSGVSRDIKK